MKYRVWFNCNGVPITAPVGNVEQGILALAYLNLLSSVLPDSAQTMEQHSRYVTDMAVNYAKLTEFFEKAVPKEARDGFRYAVACADNAFKPLRSLRDVGFSSGGLEAEQEQFGWEEWEGVGFFDDTEFANIDEYMDHVLELANGTPVT